MMEEHVVLSERPEDQLKAVEWALSLIHIQMCIRDRYEVVLAAGDGKLDGDEETMKSYDKVVAAIAQHEKTITCLLYTSRCV